MDPWRRCRIRPSPHGLERILERGFPRLELERMIREGSRSAEGGNRYLVRYGNWVIHVHFRHCFISVRTVYLR
jgi:hypothetical protein